MSAMINGSSSLGECESDFILLFLAKLRPLSTIRNTSWRLVHGKEFTAQRSNLNVGSCWCDAIFSARTLRSLFSTEPEG
jgi:hypothetical protein